jgi:DNA invertase Pin-like site-specific DNA recombinase
MARYGYARISTRSQRDDSQLDALRAVGCERIWADTASGKLARRPEWDNCLDHLRAGDELAVTRLSRMARSVRHLTETAALLAGRGIDLVVLKQGIDTTTPAGRFTFHVLAAMDEMLADLISEGTREGLESARARGRAGGRKPKLTTRQAEVARGMYDETGADGKRKYTVAEIAETFGVSRKTIYRHLEPSAGRRQTGKSTRPAAPAGPLATLPDPAHDRASEPAARPRARPAATRAHLACPACGREPATSGEALQHARTSPSSGCTSTATTSPRPGTAWHASRTGPSSTSAAPAAATAP